MSNCGKKSGQAALVANVEKQINGKEEKKLYTADEEICENCEEKERTGEGKKENSGRKGGETP